MEGHGKETLVSDPKKEERLALIKEDWATFAASVSSRKSGDSQFGEPQPDFHLHITHICQYPIFL